VKASIPVWGKDIRIHRVPTKHDDEIIQRIETLYNSFDQTALIAFGMLVEEIMTATLLPLAQAHVARCRRLQKEDSESKTVGDRVPRTSPAHAEFILPADEALLNLIYSPEADQAAMASAAPPSRKRKHPSIEASMLVDHTTASQQWIEKQGLSLLPGYSQVASLFVPELILPPNENSTERIRFR